MPRKPPELVFQKHIADFLIREHGYGVLEQDEITDQEHCIAEDHLWAFLRDSQPETVRKLAEEYSTDARDEVLRALRAALGHAPLWVLIRHGLKVRGLTFQLYYPKPRSEQSVAAKLHGKNRITFRPHFYFGETNQEIDFVFFLNGLPIVALELKHEANQTVHDAVAQFAARDHARRIFQHPFLYLAADTSEVMAATDPRAERNFRWFNTGLANAPMTAGEYPVEYLYREVLSKERLLEALAFFLVRVPKREAEDDRPARAAFTLFPRYHQSRMVRKVADVVTKHFAATGNVGRKLLINHSAGERQDALDLLARGTAAQPLRPGDECEAARHGFHPHGPAGAGQKHPRRDRELRPTQGRDGTREEVGGRGAVPRGAEADHRDDAAEIRVAARPHPARPGARGTARGIPHRRGAPLAGRAHGGENP